MGALGELLASLGGPFLVRIHSNSVQIVLPKPICVCIGATSSVSGQETLRKRVKDRCGIDKAYFETVFALHLLEHAGREQ